MKAVTTVRVIRVVRRVLPRTIQLIRRKPITPFITKKALA